MNKSFLAISLSLLVFLGAISEAYSGVPEDPMERFLDRLIAGEVDDAVDNLFDSDVVTLVSPGVVELLRSQIQTAINLYGTPFEYDKIESREISPRLIRLKYIVYHNIMPTVWEGIVYRKGDKWGFVWFNFTDKIQNH